MVIWIDDHEGYNQDKILKEIDDYITHLTKVVTEETFVEDDNCSNVTFGHFKIVVNKMIRDISDEELEKNLFYIENNMFDNDAKSIYCSLK